VPTGTEFAARSKDELPGTDVGEKHVTPGRPGSRRGLAALKRTAPDGVASDPLARLPEGRRGVSLSGWAQTA
jgi:hypothetical protein